MEFTKAIRKSVPMLISISSVSGGGKTYSGLLMAAGIAGPNGRVGMIDTENGRGSMYADSPGIVKAYPNGYDIAQLDPPFSPARYIEAVTSAEKAGITVLIIDSTSHEWEGIGGACEIAETKKLRGMPNWALAKTEHKKFVNHCLSSNMHILFCLRARDKVKIVKDANGKDQIMPIGIQPIAEKNFVFEMLLSLQLEEATHNAQPIKVPEPLMPLFKEARLISVSDGERIRHWNEGGRPLDPHEQLRKRARAAADGGMVAYKEFYSSLTANEKAGIKSIHEENKKIAEQVDREAASQDEPLRKDLVAVPEYETLPHPSDFASGDVVKVRGGSSWMLNLAGQWEKLSEVTQ